MKKVSAFRQQLGRVEPDGVDDWVVWTKPYDGAVGWFGYTGQTKFRALRYAAREHRFMVLRHLTEYIKNGDCPF